MNRPLKPHALAPDPDTIPQTLKDLAQWVVWRYAPNAERDKWTKVPLQAKAALEGEPYNASSTRPKTWTDFATARKAYTLNPPTAGDIPIDSLADNPVGHDGLDGVGFILTPENGITGIDLDHCLDLSGKLLEWAVPIRERFAGTYLEVSPSGTGIRIFCYGEKPSPELSKVGEVEVYDGRSKNGKQGGRYLTVTGHSCGAPEPITDQQDAVTWLYETYLVKPKTKASQPRQTGTSNLVSASVSDTDLLERMFASKSGAAIRALWDGDASAYASGENDGESEADLALCSHLLWWCNYDTARADTLFRQSGLVRQKWDELRGSETYGQLTLAKASEGKGAGDGYSPEATNAVEDSTANTGREIVVTGRWLRDISDDAKAALLAANNPETRFMRGSILARVSGEKIEPLTNTTLKSDLDRIADFVKETWKPGEDGAPERITTPARPPADLAPDLLGRLDLDLPELDEIVNAPVFLPDGSLLAQDGYNREHKILLKLRGLSGVKADMPVEDALRLLDTVYADFPFTDDAGRAHTFALTLERFVRPLIQGATPMYLIDAPARGTGKGLLAEVSNLIPLGYFTPTMSQPRDSDEAEKRITSVLLEARPVVFWDNVTRLGSDPLHAVLTSQVWQGRILGKSETVTVPNRAVWLASGNNVELSDEMTRRIIPIRLDAGVERPEERTSFTIKDLPAYVRKHRSELVSACLSLIQAWVTEGMPKGEATLGRYESWAGVLGGILEVSGVSGFLSGRERLHSEADKETTEWTSFCEAWWSTFGERAVTASELFEIVKERKLLLDLWGGRSGLAAAQRFGRALTSRRDRVFGGFKLMNAGKDAVTNSNAYRLECVTTQTPETRSTVMKQAETPSETKDGFTGFVPGSDAKPGETRQEPGDNPEARNGVQHDVYKPSTPSYRVSRVSNQPQARGTPHEVEELFRRFKVGEFEGQAIKLPVGRTDDLGKVLEGYFGKVRLTETERHDLLGIAQAVLAQTGRETVGV